MQMTEEAGAAVADAPMHAITLLPSEDLLQPGV